MTIVLPHDKEFMQQCLKLAKQAAGQTAPNPMVGALVTNSDGEIVGRGFHPQAGQPHAEIFALNEAQDKARGGTLYVNLEPCCHFGRTPPCLQQVITSGIKKIVIGMQDPNPQVSGQSIKALAAAGITTTVGTLEKECKWLNRGFIKRVTQNLPWLILKLATTLDGKIADRKGQSRWISGQEARYYVHQMRSHADCILIGANTAIKDDPELTVRDISVPRHPARAVIDPLLRLTPGARLCSPRNNTPRTFIFTLPQKYDENKLRYPDHVEIIPCPAISPEHTRLNLKKILACLATKGMNTVLCEGGGQLSASLLEDGLVDEISWIIAPKLLVDGLATPALAGTMPVSLRHCLQLQNLTFRQLGQDLLITAQINPGF